MRTPQERLKSDPVFAALVQQFTYLFAHHCGSGAGLTPSEIREASGLAWQIYMERHPNPILVTESPEGREVEFLKP